MSPTIVIYVLLMLSYDKGAMVSAEYNSRENCETAAKNLEAKYTKNSKYLAMHWTCDPK